MFNNVLYHMYVNQLCKLIYECVCLAFRPEITDMTVVHENGRNTNNNIIRYKYRKRKVGGKLSKAEPSKNYTLEYAFVWDTNE